MSLLLIIASAFSFALFPGDDPEMSEEETLLYQEITQYRISLGLPAIPFSKSLGKVARLHAQDLMTYPPKAPCNMHSWSKNGKWKSCCYTPDHKQAVCMWNKPKELSSYPGNGYEISAMNTSPDVDWLAQWKNSTPHHQVIVNQGIWKGKTWNAMGIGIRKPYAVVWFGMEEDVE